MLYDVLLENVKWKETTQKMIQFSPSEKYLFTCIWWLRPLYSAILCGFIYFRTGNIRTFQLKLMGGIYLPRIELELVAAYLSHNVQLLTRTSLILMFHRNQNWFVSFSNSHSPEQPSNEQLWRNSFNLPKLSVFILIIILKIVGSQ